MWHRVVRIDGAAPMADARTTLVLAQRDDALPEPIHFGAPLPPDEDLEAFAAAHWRPRSGGSLDTMTPVSTLPEEGRSAVCVPGIEITAPDGTRALTAFRVTMLDVRENAVAIVAEEPSGLTLHQHLVFDGAVLVGTTRLTNHGRQEPVLVQRLAAPLLPVPATCERIRTYGGRWIAEFDTAEVPFVQGRHVRESRLGRTSHEHTPFALFCAPNTAANTGEAMAVHLAWSGGHTMTAEELADGRRLVAMAPVLRAGEIILSDGESFETPALHAAHTGDGLSGIARQFQSHVRGRIGTHRSPRPVTANSWEAVYFDHRDDRLYPLAEAAADLGAERFLLDDGWFGARDDDTTSLGDWTVDLRKWPDGLGPFIAHVNGLGMEFGLWVEPEMVNEESTLYRSHPDWLLRDPARPPVPGRQQHVLDLGQPAVSAFLFDAVSTLLSAHPIRAIKWDHNRSLTAAANAAGRFAVVRHTQAFYALLDRLTAAHPDVEFESCASGGARIDYGVLSRTGRVWLSDSNDAVERMRMQNTASLFLPPEIVGSHVGPRVCHTSGRTLPMATRAWIAALRHMGFELDLTDLQPADHAELKRAVAWHKENRDLLHGGRIALLDMSEPDAFGEMVVAPGGERFIAALAFTRAPARASSRPQRLAGLDPAARYTVRMANPEAVTVLSRGHAAALLWEGLTLSGAALMDVGLLLPLHTPATVFVLEGTLR